MSATSLSLLDRLRRAPVAADWDRLDAMYRPLIRGWLARVPGLRDDLDDTTQEVMLVLVREIPAFERQREGSFRAWLRRVTVNRVREHWRQLARRPRTGVDDTTVGDFLDQLEDPGSELTALWDREHDKHVFDRLLESVRPDFQPATWEAFHRFALRGTPAARVAADLGLIENAVVLAKARVLRRLREEAGVLID